MPFPSVLSTFNRPLPTDRLNSPSHSALHNTVSSAVGQIEAVIGTSASALGTIMGDIHNANSNGGGHVQTANKGGTGQTSYNKGDILVAQSSSVLTKLAVGADGTLLKANSSVATGVSWGNSPITVTSIVTSSVFTVPSTATRMYVEIWGGGGSGGAGSGLGEVGGGGGGGYVGGFVDVAKLPSSVVVMIGAGGDGLGTNNLGLPGGITVFHAQTSLLTAYGGGAGGEANSGAGGGGGAGTYNTGSDASGSSGGGGGSILSGNGGNTDVAGGDAWFGAGGGGDGRKGGHANYGGAGGGGVRASLIGLGGVSAFGGNGGNSSVLTVGSAMGGFTPGGGGGAAYGTAGAISGGKGGSGMARITIFG